MSEATEALDKLCFYIKETCCGNCQPLVNCTTNKLADAEKTVRKALTGDVDLEELKKPHDMPKFKGAYHDKVNTKWHKVKGWNDCIDHLVEKGITGGGWQDIESAPKDRSRILVTRYPFDGRCPLNIVRWCKGHYDSEGWNITRLKRLRWEPTHWRPLPEPPKEYKFCKYCKDSKQGCGECGHQKFL